MQRTYQRRYILGLLGIELLGSLLSLGHFTFINRSPPLIWPLIGAVFISGSCLWGYWFFNSRIIIYINVILTMLFTSFLFILPNTQTSISTVLFLPAAITMVMLNSFWTLTISISTYIIVLIRAPIESPYFDIHQILSYGIVMGCLFAGGQLIETVKNQSQKSLKDARTTRDQLQALTLQTEAQAQELHKQTEKQNQLIQLLSSLELPLIQMGQHTLLVPLVGDMQHERIQRINEQILQAIRSKRIQQIILDISQRDNLDTGLVMQIQQLIQAIRLLGSKAILSGISAATASSLTIQGIQLNHVHIVQSPADILEQQEGET